jgi:hypothetical protein
LLRLAEERAHVSLAAMEVVDPFDHPRRRRSAAQEVIEELVEVHRPVHLGGRVEPAAADETIEAYLK